MRVLPAVLALLLFASPAGAQTVIDPADGIAPLLRELERVVRVADSDGYRRLLAGSAGSQDDFLQDWLVMEATRVTVVERLRVPVPDLPEGEAYDIYVDALAEYERVGRAGTWLLKVRREADAWRITELNALTTVRGLYRLAINPAKQFDIVDLNLAAEDFELRVPSGVAFVAETDAGITGIVILGRGEMTFAPTPEPEKGQVRIFSGSDAYDSRFSWVYLRAHPAEFDRRLDVTTFVPREVDVRDLKRAETVFEDNLSRSFSINLADLSTDRWSVIPKFGDFVAEIQADRAHVAYMRSMADPEDIRFVDRSRGRTIAIYASSEKLATRGPFYSEDDSMDVDIVNIDVDASFDPRREWFVAKATLLVTARREDVTSIVLNLAESFALQSVLSRRYGYLMALRVSGQDDIIINLPQPLLPDELTDLEFTYSGRLPAVPPDREALALQQDLFNASVMPSYVYSGRSVWYPQSEVTDYATAALRLRVPHGYSSAATGSLEEGYPRALPVDAQGGRWSEYRFSATQPVRYLAWATSRFVEVETGSFSIEPRGDDEVPLRGASYPFGQVTVYTNGILHRGGRDLFEEAQRVMTFFGTVMGDVPYPSFTVAVLEDSQPGGHSPPYFAVLNQPQMGRPVLWRGDPAHFDGFPEFFLAHEAAHQWWGHAVGWKNYHEQWLSEGFSQYFAALYAEHAKRGGVFQRIVSQMVRWTLDQSDQGPVYLGYRLGHIRNDGRVFRALVYNKGALTLHMLRRLLGDDMFFRGLRRFYATWRFRKAGTEDLKAAFELEANRDLDLFFERWIYGSSLPRLRFSYKAAPDAVLVRVEQVGDVFEVPVTVTVRHGAGSTEVVLPLREQVSTHRIPVSGAVRGVALNQDNAAPVILVR